MNHSQIIDTIKQKWIAEFGGLQHELSACSGYFIAGFVADAIKGMTAPEPISDFKTARFNARLTLREVQKATGISNAYLSQLENGLIKKPSHDTVQKLTAFYNNLNP